MTWRRLDLALALVVLAAPLFMHPKFVGHEQFSLSEILILLDVAVGGVYVLRPATRARLDLSALRATPFLAPAALFLLAGTASTLFAADRHLALRAYREWILEPEAFFGLLLVVRSSASVRTLRLHALVAAGFGASIVGLVQWVTGRGLAQTPGSSVRLVQSVYTSADNLGLLFDRVIPIWLALTLSRLRSRTAGWWAVLGGLFLLVLALSRSRGAEAGVMVGALAVLALLYGRGRRFAIAIAVLAVLTVVASVIGGEKILHAINAGHANTARERLYVWQSALEMIRSHPIVGVGPNNFLHYYAPLPGHPGAGKWNPCPPGLGYLNSAQVAILQPCLSHPHNEILDFWLSTGLLGLISFGWLQVVFWRAAVTGFLQASGIRTFLLAGIMGAMAASLVHGLVDNSYFLPDLSVFFWLLCASADWLRTDMGADESMVQA